MPPFPLLEGGHLFLLAKKSLKPIPKTNEVS